MKNSMPPERSNTDLNNLSSQRIYIEYPIWFRFSEEKLKNLLEKYKKNLETRRFWLIPLSILIPLIFTVLTSNFKDISGSFLKADHIRTSCYIVILLIFVWLVISIVRSFRSKSVEKIIFDLKKELEERHIKSPSLEEFTQEKYEVLPCSKLSHDPQRKLENKFKKIIIDAIHQANFREYTGLYKDINDEIIFKVAGREKKEYIIVAHYLFSASGIYFPSEQIEKHFSKALKMGFPYIIATNALEPTQKAIEVLNEFNKKYEKPKIFVITGINKDEFIKKFKKIIE